MLDVCKWTLALACVVVCENAGAGVLQEDFGTDPTAHGWRSFGDTNLFRWDSAAGTLEVTWDSSRSNSYFFHPLGTVLAKSDDFSLEFDLELRDIATTTKTGPFEIAVGFINLADATRSDYWRGSGVNADHGPRNLVEFDYFPAGYYPDWGDVAPSISPTIVSSNNLFASQFALLELTNGHPIHISLVYTASNATLRTSVSSDGARLGAIDDVVLDPSFTDFRADTVAICSYSDVGDDYDSVLAHGVIDNLTVVTPEPPVGMTMGAFSNGVWQVQFLSRTNWTYTLERTTDLHGWNDVSSPTSGNEGLMLLEDAAPPGSGAWYRVRAQRL